MLTSGRVGARGVNPDGDDQAHRKAHGGPDKAVYAYAVEDIRWWDGGLGGAMDVGGFDENLTTEGLDDTDAVVDEQWQVGTARLAVSEARLPCWRLNLRIEDTTFVRQFLDVAEPSQAWQGWWAGNGPSRGSDRVVVQQEVSRRLWND